MHRDSYADAYAMSDSHPRHAPAPAAVRRVSAPVATAKRSTAPARKPASVSAPATRPTSKPARKAVVSPAAASQFPQAAALVRRPARAAAAAAPKPALQVIADTPDDEVANGLEDNLGHEPAAVAGRWQIAPKPAARAAGGAAHGALAKGKAPPAAERSPARPTDAAIAARTHAASADAARASSFASECNTLKAELARLRVQLEEHVAANNALRRARDSAQEAQHSAEAQLAASQRACSEAHQAVRPCLSQTFNQPSGSLRTGCSRALHRYVDHSQLADCPDGMCLTEARLQQLVCGRGATMAALSLDVKTRLRWASATKIVSHMQVY